MENTVKERLKRFIEFKKISTRQFCLAIGVSPSFVANMVRSIQPDKMDSIAKCFPELNIGWLLTGEGEMLKPPKNVFSQVPQNVMKETLTQEVVNYVQGLFESGKAYHASAVKLMLEEKDKEIERLREENRKMQEEITNLKTKREP